MILTSLPMRSFLFSITPQGAIPTVQIFRADLDMCSFRASPTCLATPGDTVETCLQSVVYIQGPWPSRGRDLSTCVCSVVSVSVRVCVCVFSSECVCVFTSECVCSAVSVSVRVCVCSAAVVCTGLRRGGGGEMALWGHNHRPGGGILCHVGFSILKLFERHSQTNVSIIKTNPFKVAKYNKGCRYLGQSGQR